MTLARDRRSLRVVALGNDHPSGKVSHKFVLMSSDDELVLVHGPVAGFRYHAALVRAFCDREGIPSDWVRKPDQVEVFDSQWEIVGGGWLDIDHDHGRAGFHGHSTAYGGFREQDVRRFAVDHPFFAPFAVNVSR